MFENQPKPIINNKKFLLCSRAILQKQGHKERQSSLSLTKNNLLKYFPKYIHELVIETKSGLTISKVKRTKILHIFQGYQNFYWRKGLRRTLLYNKEKHIQTFYNGSGILFLYSKHLAQEVRAFTGLRSLKLQSQSQFGSLVSRPQRLYYLRKICKEMKGLRKLEHLELQINSTNYLKAISAINSDEKRLKSLKTLKVDCFWKDNSNHSTNILKGLLKSKNILKSTTHLSLSSLSHETLSDLLEETLTCCPKLIFLSFAIDQPKPEESPREEYIPRSYFQALENFHNLQGVSIVCKDAVTLLRDFTLPPPIQEVDLKLIPFEPSQFNDGNPANGDLPLILTTFCDKWKHFKNLQTLKVFIGQKLDSKGIVTLQFVQYWLKRVNNIKDLTLELSAEVPSQYDGQPPIKGDFDFSVFLESIQHLKNTLESLIVLDTQLIYYLKNLPEQSFGFPHLHKLSLKGFMPSQDFQSQKLFQMNLRDLMLTGSNQKPFEVLLEGLHFDSSDSFLNFIKSFDHKRIDQQRPLKIMITAYLDDQDSSLNDKFWNYFTLRAPSLKIQVKVSSSVPYAGKTAPSSLIKKSLSVLKFRDEFLG